MKFTVSIEIAQPRERVAQLLADRSSGPPMRLAAPLLLHGTFRTQALRHTQDLTAFAERGTDVRGVEG